jgi:hypothetical protein
MCDRLEARTTNCRSEQCGIDEHLGGSSVIALQCSTAGYHVFVQSGHTAALGCGGVEHQAGCHADRMATWASREQPKAPWQRFAATHDRAMPGMTYADLPVPTHDRALPCMAYADLPLPTQDHAVLCMTYNFVN